MTQTIRVPDPVYSKLTREAERKDVAHGVVVREWMDKAEQYDRMEGGR